MYTSYYEKQVGQADKKAVQTLSREVSRIITDQVKKSMSLSSKEKVGKSSTKK